MAAPTDSAYVDPNAATTPLDEQDAFNTVLDQLADPAGILANALMRIHQADAVMLAPPAPGAEKDRDLIEIQAVYRLGSAFVLRGIAEAAMALQEAPLHLQPRIPVESGPAPVVNEPRYKPQATRLRFTVRYPGRDLGDAVWVPVLAAYVDKRGFYPSGPSDTDRDAGCDIVLNASGRIVSATPAAVMAITDGGEVLCLRRGVGEYAEGPDE